MRERTGEPVDTTSRLFSFDDLFNSLFGLSPLGFGSLSDEPLETRRLGCTVHYFHALSSIFTTDCSEHSNLVSTFMLMSTLPVHLSFEIRQLSEIQAITH
jgi:hypothetical protein